MESPDFQRHLADILNWHFSPDTGSPFWLSMRSQLDFDPVKDVRSLADLSLFPDISQLLREIAIEDLQPKGLADYRLAGIFESGGTTGTAKRVVAYEAWLEQVVSWRLEGFETSTDKTPKNTLAIIPTGPHIVEAINRRRARAFGGQCFTVDLDPRWVKKLIQAGNMEGARDYSDHLIDQAEPIIATQAIKYLIATPPLLEAIARRRSLAETLNSTLEMITWGGTHMDVDTLDYLKTMVFPDVPITASYGSTMILSETKARINQDYNGSPIFDSYAPYVILEVVDPESGKPVEYNGRGQVVMNHLSRFAFFPNIFERDTAVRLPTLGNCPGSSVSDVKPVAQVSGKAVIEGVY
ncbi:phenazine antibiotic biosynthesis protein [Microbulbifer sp. MLAF003]|uniref:phenazine antibiotic biosynthesis protein n=1 Tax=Microbulbifer sp. MLAF003 TaxID=3032582 RepID=UPI0024AD631A|nr:phenazine antibiotic biosynthesis protein [Microbulbifer sp. MLAF003]WHI52288.1 phenazine antibiotic biosynthesis protein [Microbulbifer sp. MLAF003]